MRQPRISPALLRLLPVLLIAAATLLTLLRTRDAVGELPSHPQGPGLTLDEIFNIEAGVSLWRATIHHGLTLFSPRGARQVFGQPDYNHDHPPLGRLAIGAAHDLALSLAPPEQTAGPYSVAAARAAPALAFAITVLIVGLYTLRWYGSIAATAAALATALMLRLFGHAHLASLETSIGLTFTLTVLAIADRWATPYPAATDPPPDRPENLTRPLPSWRAVIVVGGFLGLALLTKIQAVLLPIPVALWALCLFGPKAIPRILVWGLVGVALFFLLWPWLWLDPIGHTLEYLGRTRERPILYCYYLGERYADRDVPWHYPFVMAAATIPVGTLVLGLIGCRGQLRRDPRATLLIAVILFVLAFFALPTITVYDGVRLFLVIFPLWALLAGRGVAHLCSWLTSSTQRACLAAGLIVLFGAQAIELAKMHPLHLSSYSPLVGGLRGADRLGFEPTYWRDSITRDLLHEAVEHLPAGSTIYLAPVLHPANRIDLPLLSPILQKHRLQIDAYDDRDPSKADMQYVLVFRRHADPWASLEPAPANGHLLAQVERNGVQLAALYQLAEK